MLAGKKPPATLLLGVCVKAQVNWTNAWNSANLGAKRATIDLAELAELLIDQTIDLFSFFSDLT